MIERSHCRETLKQLGGKIYSSPHEAHRKAEANSDSHEAYDQGSVETQILGENRRGPVPSLPRLSKIGFHSPSISSF